jgi:hypothetical protein
MAIPLVAKQAHYLLTDENLPTPAPGESVLLRTGAKLYHAIGRNHWGTAWHVDGYHHSGDDWKAYSKYCTL